MESVKQTSHSIHPVEKAYEEIVNFNSFKKFTNWINPELKLLKNKEYRNELFLIKMDDFEYIYESKNVQVINIKKERNNKITIHCKIKTGSMAKNVTQ